MVINFSKPRLMLQDKLDEAIFNYKMNSTTTEQQKIKTLVETTATTITITLLCNTPASAGSFDKIAGALNPLLDLIQALGYPVAVLSMSGGAITMMFNKRMGVRIIKDTAVAYLVLQFVPGLMKILMDVGKAIR
ncbi:MULTISPECIES: TrbC/VirB2 family protein [Clostridium]|uniref:Bacitracin ABC transporter ATP-binding protein n=1 Tax=Clostridium sporogenes TaxID=1509 RepID=A0A7X5SWN1_CLOSG|nr:TrbC/VirB2 family protein [Clostridium sporogenes]AJD30391.1 trbC/VIRB2 family protein [Clostridium botulinum Prevot_594]MBY7016682.1 bacitracin ABC transporter ATP-binding protein [Clostridium sporogenes]MCW6078218.1 bacitracin ABC transporter ATP-binding protein [Clostridium sporogenes]NFQ17009.1 bacitracin ABC transporter ATP-binding protein [Clostridium sporogenes]NFQ21096.1 bacitracin ABC transporter ATP-binding protein [Clostridium sporogenes]